jgi:hypothetical protein
MLRPEGYLFDEVSFLLRAELTSPATYNSILAAVAQGAEKVGDIALAVGVDSTTANKYLHVLRELRLVSRDVPVTDPNPLRSRRGRYSIADRFLTFHFRHLQPNLSLIHAGRGQHVFDKFIAPDLERIFDEARVDFALSHMRRQAAEVLGDEVVEAGKFDGQFVRIVGRTAGGQTVAGVIVPDGQVQTAALEDELAELTRVFGVEPQKLVYGITGRVDRPLEVEHVPEGELL